MEADSSMETGHSSQDDQKKKRRVLKRVLKKDKIKAKGFKQKGKLNTSLTSLSKSFNRSVTSLVIKQTLQSNNRQLAMTLERTRQELRIANSRELELRGEIVDLQTQVSTYKHMAGLKPEQIENEVKYRMEKYISDLKTHLGKMGQQLFEASASLGDAMDLCMTVSRRSTSCRSSAVSVMSDDEEDSHHAVRPAMLQTEVLTSDILPRNIPQRVACLDMSVIAEQSMLQEDIPGDQDDLPTDMDLQEELIEEENFPQNMVSESDEENVVTETENVVDKNQKNDNKSDNKKTDSKAGSEKVSKNTDNKKENEKVESEKSKPGKEKMAIEGESMNKKAMPVDDFKSTKSKTETCSSINGVKTDQKNKSEEKDLKSDQALRENVCNMQNKQDKEKAHTVKIDEKKAENKRSKQRRETYVLPENAAQQENCIATKKVEHKQNSRRGTFVVKETKSDDTGTESEENEVMSLKENNQSEASNPVSKTRRETFVLPSKSHDQITSKNDLKNPTKSKSDGFLTMDDERRKTFLVPAPKERNVPKSVPQTNAVKTFDDPEVTEYFNCDMDFTEVIDNSNRIILESSNPPGKHSNKMNSKDQDKDGKSSSQKSNDNNKASVENKTENKGPDNEKKKDNQAAVEFRVPKPGKIIFAASRKKFDGKREPVPTKLPQRSRSKPKVKLSKTNEKDESIKSMFDFHEKTPTVLKQQSSVYDLSMNESVHGQKESFSSFRDKMHNAEQTKLQEEPGKDKEKVSNDNGEIIYHLPLKGCSPDIPKARGRSQSRGRSRGKTSVVVEDDKKTSTSRSKSRGRSEAESTEDEKSSASRARSRSRGRSRGKRMVVVDDDDDDEMVDVDNEAKKSTTRSKSRGRPNKESVEEDESSVARGRSRSKKRVEEVATTRRSRSSKRNEAKAVELSPSRKQGDDDDVDKVLQRRSRSRRRHMTEDEESSQRRGSVENSERRKEELDNIQTKEKESEISKKPDAHSKRSKSRSRPRKLNTKDTVSAEEEKVSSDLESNREADEQLNNGKPTRSKSRRRQKSEINYCESDTELEEKDTRKQDETKKKKARSKSVSSKTDTEVGSHLENTEPEKEMEVDDEIKQPKDNLLECTGDQIINNKEDVNIDKHKDTLQTDKEEMVRNKSVGRSRSKSGKISKTISSDDDDDFQLQKKSTKKPKRKSNSELDPLDQLFKNAKKKSICEVLVTSDTTSDEFSAPVPDESFHVICETPMKPKDTSQTKIDNDNKDQKQTKELSDTESKNLESGKLDMDLKCVTKRARSKKHSVKKSDDFNLSEDVEKPHVVEDKDKSFVIENLDNNSSGKRLHSTLSNSEEEKKNKKFKNENKENTGSSLNSLKKRLASLGTSLKPQAVVSEAVSGSEEVPEIKDNEKERMSQGKGVFTPSSENVNGVSKSRRAAANVCYKEVPLRTKLRREDVLAGKKLV